MSETEPTHDDPPDLQEILEADASGRRKRLARWVAVLVVVATAVVAIVLLSGPDERSPAPRFMTSEIVRATLVVRVSATGNLQPTNQVQIGSELSGIVSEVFVEENERVTAGQVLVRLDPARLDSSVANARASLQVARAQVMQAEAGVGGARAALGRLEELSRISEGRLPAGAELDAANAAVEQADANLAAARARVSQVRANLRSEETNLEKATIRSPIDGVVLVRAVEPGQTVAATLQAPVLFTIAEDLANMELRVDIDEADVGQVAVGQHATFSVDTWPGRIYEGVIVTVGLGAQVRSDVVSYPAVLAVANSDLSLRPGMTATASIVTLTRDDTLLVPNAALRFDLDASSQGGAGARRGIESLLPQRPPQRPAVEPVAGIEGPRVWTVVDAEPVLVTLETGATNGTFTEVLGGDLREGVQVITELAGGGL